MFSIRDEGEVVKQGFNFYPLKSNHVGFLLKIKKRIITVRYSKIHRKFVCSHYYPSLKYNSAEEVIKNQLSLDK